MLNAAKPLAHAADDTCARVAYQSVCAVVARMVIELVQFPLGSSELNSDRHWIQHTENRTVLHVCADSVSRNSLFINLFIFFYFFIMMSEYCGICCRIVMPENVLFDI